jgi:hypothetical protein
VRTKAGGHAAFTTSDVPSCNRRPALPPSADVRYQCPASADAAAPPRTVRRRLRATPTPSHLELYHFPALQHSPPVAMSWRSHQQPSNPSRKSTHAVLRFRHPITRPRTGADTPCTTPTSQSIDARWTLLETACTITCHPPTAHTLAAARTPPHARTRPAGPPGPPHPVHVVSRGAGEVVVDNRVDRCKVHPARNEVRGDQDPRRARAEVVDGRAPRRVGLVGGDGVDAVAVVTQLLVQRVCALLRHKRHRWGRERGCLEVVSHVTPGIVEALGAWGVRSRPVGSTLGDAAGGPWADGGAAELRCVASLAWLVVVVGFRNPRSAQIPPERPVRVTCAHIQPARNEPCWATYATLHCTSPLGTCSDCAPGLHPPSKQLCDRHNLWPVLQIWLMLICSMPWHC